MKTNKMEELYKKINECIYMSGSVALSVNKFIDGEVCCKIYNKTFTEIVEGKE